VLVLNGYYDLATPFSATEIHDVAPGLASGTSSRIQMKVLPKAGHMMYVNPPSLKKMKGDLDALSTRRISVAGKAGPGPSGNGPARAGCIRSSLRPYVSDDDANYNARTPDRVSLHERGGAIGQSG